MHIHEFIFYFSLLQVAENIKEFFHREGIHSTTVQPEFVDYHPASANAATTADEDCVLDCPKGPGSNPIPDCEASKCCSNGDLKKQTSKSLQSTPTNSRRPTSFHEQEVSLPPNYQSDHSTPGLRSSTSSCSTSNLAEATPLTEVVATPTPADEASEATPMHALEDHRCSTASVNSWH